MLLPQYVPQSAMLTNAAAPAFHARILCSAKLASGHAQKKVYLLSNAARAIFRRYRCRRCHRL
jgi:hypothetical protein